MYLFNRVDPSPEVPCALWRRTEDVFGIPELDLVYPPRRFFVDQDNPPPVARSNYDARRAQSIPSFVERCRLLTAYTSSESQRTISKLVAWFLVCEDRQNRLDAREVQTLAHQASLVRFILDSPHLRRALIGDEVGLGKTIEAGLIVRELLYHEPRLRICYLSPARLVDNVCTEFDRLGLQFRKWNSDANADANLQRDDRIVASIHRAAHERNSSEFEQTLPWDVIIVDECHHLSNYDPDGYSPRRQYALVQALINRQPPTGRLLLMSGTPHQGHPDRFKNLLRLLSDDHSQPNQGAQRVIFRTKEDVRDWRGDPLFPSRRVHPPRVMNAPPEYYAWLEAIHACYTSGIGGDESQRRAGGWRAAQALQWAASSVHAGLGYLIRSAIRNGWTQDRPQLQTALGAIRPYRMGKPDEPVGELFSRISRAIGNPIPEEEDEEDDDRWQPDPEELGHLLERGVLLLRNIGDQKWEFVERELLQPAGGDQVVLFAQPIETVCALAQFLERREGIRPSMIIGGQEQAERNSEVARFWQGETQFLVGSRAAYEGFNLQCAHRVIHLDIPWNPMDLEQRVGRVHRFGSRKTIIVDSVVTSQSREADAYGTAFNRLREIAQALAPDDERMQLLFARIMNLIPPQSLEQVLLMRPVAGLSPAEREQIAGMVDDGLETWQEFHDAYRANSDAIRALEPGAADWSDLENFLCRCGRAEAVGGFSAEGFQHNPGGEIMPTSEPARVLRVNDQGRDRVMVCADVAGRLVSDANGQRASVLGLNLPFVCKILRGSAFSADPSQLCALRVRPEQRELVSALLDSDIPACLGIAAKQSIRRRQDNQLEETGRRLFGWRISESGAALLADEVLAEILRMLPSCIVRREPPELAGHVVPIEAWEQRTLHELRRPTDEDRSAGVSHTIHPLGIIHIDKPT